MASTSSLDELSRVVRTCPVVDNHAHNLLLPERMRAHDLLTITTEAEGGALADTPKSLSHLRAARQLRALYGLKPDADWDTISRKRLTLLDQDANGLIKRCFEGTQTVLVDDGLGKPNEMESYHWHDHFTKSPCKRIVRIEAVAADILSAMHQQGKLPIGIAIADDEACSLAWVDFISAFEQAIATSLADPDVAGFKSVICYRTGLRIQLGKDMDVTEAGLRSFRRNFLPTCVMRRFRVAHKGMNDALVISVCKLIGAGLSQGGRPKPLQFHTGLGDNDISLLDSNPACMQPLVEAFSTVPIVLLHSSYPYTREAGYLATVYSNVYLDIGEVFPMVSRDGQEKIVRQALELTPTSRILWSTDGHHLPETYYLANLQGREAIEKVMTEYVEKADFTVDYAVQAVRDIFYNNSNKIYDLGLAPQEARLQLNLETRTPNQETRIPQYQETRYPTNQDARLAPFQQTTDLPISNPPNPTNAQNLAVVQNADRSVTPAPNTQNLVALDASMELYWVQWVDYLGTLRVRCIPAREFHRLGVSGGLKFAISKGNLGTLQNDGPTPVMNPVGQLYVHPDLTSLKPTTRRAGVTERAATVMASFYDEDGKPHAMCPRRTLSSVVSTLKHECKMSTRVGFEIEVTFCRRNASDAAEAFSPLDTNHAWSSFTDEQFLDGYQLMLATHRALQEMGIHVQQMHSEAGAGQYEFVLPPAHPLTAVDTLVQARQCIQQMAAARGLRATLHPAPFHGVGSAAHAHISMHAHGGANAPDDLEKQQLSFMAGVLAHLPGLCAFTMPEAPSYDRVKDDSWTGGTWVAWGTQNREVPLRRIKGADGRTQRWEVRCLDGTANMYLALATIFKAGLAGVRGQKRMEMGDCLKNPSTMSSAEREQLSITRRLPASLKESMEALRTDEVLTHAIGRPIVTHYLAMKEAEQTMLDRMSEEKRRDWLIERY